ncbi:15064_t:CDS:10 [Funneliformis geosporum]|nr:15064_t:CDS:10 [Funneliformis geosporum]
MEQTIISNTSSGASNVAGERRPEIFANNFWGKEEAGYDALMSRLRQAKQTCDEVKNMFQERALRDALEVCKQEMEATAQEHITLSQKFRTELVQEISHFILRQKESRKLQQAIVDRSLRNKKEQSALVQRAKEKYEAECVKITGLLATKGSVMGKDLEKLNLRIEKTQMAAKAADQEYIQLVKNIQGTTKTWNYDWKTACNKFQDLEEDRIDKLKSFLWTYANLISTVCVADDESCERIRISLENCNVEKDILIFIKERATGPDIPEPPSYVNFYAGPKENGVRYKRASFERGYTNVNIERATLYANTTLSQKNNNNGGIVSEVERRTEKNEVEEEPVDPRSKQMLSIGDNVFEVQTNSEQLKNKDEKDEIAKAKPLPNNFTIDKPQPPTPSVQDNIQQQNTHNVYHQRNNSQLQFTPHQISSNNNTSTSAIPLSNIPISPTAIDLRRQPSDYNSAANNGPLSSQQQQISQNMSMNSKSPNRNYQQQSEGPGDVRRLSNSPNMFSSPPILSQVQYQSQHGGYQQQVQGQMTPQGLVLTQGKISPRQITSSPNVNGRVKQDDLAEAFIANGGRLPPESARFKIRPQGIPQGVQMSPQGQPIYQYNSFNRPPLQQMSANPSVITSNTLNSGSNNGFPYKQPQQGINVNSQFPQGSLGRPQGSIVRPQGSIGRPQNRRSTLPVGAQQLGHPQTHYQNPNFYNPPPIGGYQRPPIGSVKSVQGFQQMQVPQQQATQTLQLQYQRQPLPGSDIPDVNGSPTHRQRTEDGKPIEFYVKASYDYQKSIPEEMSFTAGDVIAVLSTHSDGWWEGEIIDDSRKNRGLFPSNYTKVLE